MPIIQEIVDLNKVFHQLSEPPVIINDLSINTEDSRETIKEMITTRYSSDMVSLLPSCRCGMTKGEFSKKTNCIHCGSPVIASIDNVLEPVVWFRRPQGVNKLINPQVWIMLTDYFKKGRYSLLNWIVDTKYDPNTKKPIAIINKMIDAGIQQGYNYFVDNFDQIMDFMFTLTEFRTKGSINKHARLHELIKLNRNIIFSDYIPMPNKSILLIEKTVFSTYVDTIVTNALNAIQMLISIDRDYADQSQRAKENRTAKALSTLCSDFYIKYYSDNVASKLGQIRRHMLGTRTNHSFRAVISSITGPHRYDDIEMPWGIGLTVLRDHLLNKMHKMGMSMNSAVSMLYAHIEKYSPFLDGLLKEIIAEFPGGRIPLLLNRNQLRLPSLVIASTKTL